MTGGSLDVLRDLLNGLGSFDAVDTELRYHDGLSFPMCIHDIHGLREGSMLPAANAGQHILCSMKLL